MSHPVAATREEAWCDEDGEYHGKEIEHAHAGSFLIILVGFVNSSFVNPSRRKYSVENTPSGLAVRIFSEKKRKEKENKFKI